MAGDDVRQDSAPRFGGGEGVLCTGGRMVDMARDLFQVGVAIVLVTDVRLKRGRVFPQIMPQTRSTAPVGRVELRSKSGRQVCHALKVFFERFPLRTWAAGQRMGVKCRQIYLQNAIESQAMTAKFSGPVIVCQP